MRNLSERINKYFDVVNRTLLALPSIVVWRFNGWHYAQSEHHNDNKIVRSILIAYSNRYGQSYYQAREERSNENAPQVANFQTVA